MQITFEGVKMTDTNFKKTIINIFKQLKNTRLRNLKESVPVRERQASYNFIHM